MSGARYRAEWYQSVGMGFFFGFLGGALLLAVSMAVLGEIRSSRMLDPAALYWVGTTSEGHEIWMRDPPTGDTER